jgi:hypothetical protein
MKKKGLCSTCINDKDCDFPRTFPVSQCEEFEGYEKTSQKIKNSKKTKQNTHKREKALAHT